MVLALPRQRPTADVVDWLRSSIDHDTAFGRFGLWLPVIGVVGIFAAVAAPFDPPAPAVVAAAAVAWVARIITGRSRAAALAPWFLALAAFLTGAAALSAQSAWFGTDVMRYSATDTLEGTVTSVRTREDGRTQLVLRIEGAEDLAKPWPHQVRLSVRNGGPFAVGERISVTARLFPLTGPAMPGGYDPGRRLYFDRIGATGFAYGAPERLEPPPRWSLLAQIGAVRSAITARLSAAMEPSAAGFAAAVLVGERGGLASADTEALRVAGLGHILAISGLHMALVAGGVFAAVRTGLALIPAIALRYPIKKLAALTGLASAILYLAVSGGSVATVRAFVMLSVALIAVLSERPALTMRTVAVAAVVVMALDPISVTEPGFQMSFAAVIALVGAYEWWSARRAGAIPSMWLRPVLVFMTGLAATSLIAGLATLPVGAYHFHRIAPLGLIANLMAMPIFSLITMPLGVIAMIAMPFGLEHLPLAAMDYSIRAILSVAHAVAAQTGDGGVIGAVPVIAPVLAMGGLLWAALFTGPWRIAGVLPIVVGLALLPYGPRPDVYVSPDGSAIASRNASGALAFVGRDTGFVADMWRKANGDDSQVPPALCDPLGCTLPSIAGAVAIPTSPRALAIDCTLASLVISARIRQSCAYKAGVTREDLSRMGAAALNFTPDDGWSVRWARPNGPVRAWQVPARMRY